MYSFADTPSELMLLLNQTITMVSILLAIIIIVVAMQMQKHNRRMGWFIASVCILLGGLMPQVMSNHTYIEGEEESGLFYIIVAQIMYALVAPVFSLYFIETERAAGERWNGKLWTTLQCIVMILVDLACIFGSTELFVNIAFFTQYIIVIVMLLQSSKSIKSSMGFLLGTIFPIFATFAGLADSRINVIGFGITMLLLIVFFGYQMDTERELMSKQVELSENKVSLLMEQIHPHFIYNALQQIALLCDEEPESVKPAIFNFSGYLRKNFEALTNEKMIPFEQEMEHVDAYVALSKILPSRDFEVVKDFQVTDFYLPALVIQPLVENAIYYGIGMSTEGEVIQLKTLKENGYIVIKVVDDGHGKQTKLPTQKKHKSVGTKNVTTRLKLLCDGELKIDKKPEGTEAVIRIPEMKAVPRDGDKKY